MKKKFTAITKEVDHYNSVEEFVDDILYCYDIGYGEKEFFGINIVADYTTSVSILNALIRKSDFDLYSIDISPKALDGYNGEYWITIDEDGLIFCEKAKKGDGYILVEEGNEITYVHEDVSNDFLSKNIHADMIYFTIDDDNSCDGDCEYCCTLCCDEYCEGSTKEKVANNNIVSCNSNNRAEIYKKSNDIPISFTTLWNDQEDGFIHSGSYSYFCTDYDDLRKIAKRYKIEL